MCICLNVDLKKNKITFSVALLTFKALTVHLQVVDFTVANETRMFCWIELPFRTILQNFLHSFWLDFLFIFCFLSGYWLVVVSLECDGTYL